MKVFITGATGFVGRALTLRLLRDGHQVVAWTRRPEAARDVLGAEVEIAGTDLDAHVGTVDAVVHLAGEPVMGGRWTKARRQRMWDSRVGLAERLVQAMERADRPPEVFVSAGRPDIVFYQAGCDTLAGDPLASLQMSEAGIARRDGMVIDECVARGVPAVMTLGGGYSEGAWRAQCLSVRSIIKKYGQAKTDRR